MNGAELLIKTARAAGVEVCFTNAGTTEIPIVTGLDSQPGIKAILGYKTNESPARLSQDTAEAIANSMSGQISTLIVPNDNQLAECNGSEIAAPQFSFSPVSADAIEKAVQLLRSHYRTALLLGGRALRQRGLQAAARIQAATDFDGYLYLPHLQLSVLSELVHSSHPFGGRSSGGRSFDCGQCDYLL